MGQRVETEPGGIREVPKRSWRAREIPKRSQGGTREPEMSQGRARVPKKEESYRLIGVQPERSQKHRFFSESQ